MPGREKKKMEKAIYKILINVLWHKDIHIPGLSGQHFDLLITNCLSHPFFCPVEGILKPTLHLN